MIRKFIGLGTPKEDTFNEDRRLIPPASELVKSQVDPEDCGECREVPPMNNDDVVIGYEDLQRILKLAYDQAARGKGKERHADNRGFNDQPIMLIQEMVGPGFALGQACKKVQESVRLPWNMAQNELLGAIVYIASAYIHREREESENV